MPLWLQGQNSTWISASLGPVLERGARAHTHTHTLLSLTCSLQARRLHVRRPNSFRDFVSPARGVLRRYALGPIIAVRVLIVPMIAKGLFFPQMFETCKRQRKKEGRRSCPVVIQPLAIPSIPVEAEENFLQKADANL